MAKKFAWHDALAGYKDELTTAQLKKLKKPRYSDIDLIATVGIYMDELDLDIEGLSDDQLHAALKETYAFFRDMIEDGSYEEAIEDEFQVTDA